MNTVEVPVMDPTELTAEDRCDRCGAQAYVATELALENGRTSTLLFCAHHFHEHEEHPAVHVVQDHRARINAKPSPCD